MANKYALTNETRMAGRIKLHRIVALRDIPRWGVKRGDFGGWIQSAHNLSHDGDCWVAGDGMVCEGAQVLRDARVCGRAEVYGSTRVCGSGTVSRGAYPRGVIYRNVED